MKTERYSRAWGFFYVVLFLVVLIGPFIATGHCQVSVALAPPVHPQFLTTSGLPLSGGFIYTYQAGTSTLSNTYVDSTGTTQNPDPIPLDFSGAPSNGTVQTQIWLANQAYKFCAYNAALVQQWCTDNVTGYLVGLLNLPNTWTFNQTFAAQIADTLTDDQIVFGALGNQTTLDFPPPTGNIVLHFPNTSDTMVGRATSDTLTNKTLTAPTISTPTINGCQIQNEPGTYYCQFNSGSPGTTLNSLVKFINAPSQASIASITDMGGIVGICTAQCGTSSFAVIQESGYGVCNFDGATTAGDYVQISSTVAGDCHDAGSTFPIFGQVLGRSLTTNAVAGAYSMNLFGPEIQAGDQRTICSSSIPTTRAGNTTSLQVIQTCSFPAGSLNAVGKTFRLTGALSISPGSAINSSATVGSGSSAALPNGSIVAGLGTETASATAWFTDFQVLCVVTTAGASGVLNCTPISTISGGTAAGAAGTTTTTNNNDLTSPFFVGTECSFSGASISNSCTGNLLTVEQLK